MSDCPHNDIYEESDERGTRGCCRRCGQAFTKDGHTLNSAGDPMTLDEVLTLRARAGAPVGGPQQLISPFIISLQKTMLFILIFVFAALGVMAALQEPHWMAFVVLLLASFCWGAIGAAVFFPAAYVAVARANPAALGSPLREWAIAAFAVGGGVYFKYLDPAHGWWAVVFLSAGAVPIALFAVGRARRRMGTT